MSGQKLFTEDNLFLSIPHLQHVRHKLGKRKKKVEK